MPVTLTVKTCIKCHKTLDAIHFHKRTDSKDGLMNRCKDCNRAKTAKWRVANLERAKQTQRDHYQAHKEEVKSKVRQYRQDNPLKVKMQDAVKYSNSDKSINNERSRKYRKNHPKKVLALSHNYRNKKSSKFCIQFIKHTKHIYENCPEGMVVDHIIPISNELVSGLHVPWNLQYLTPKENYIKSNKFDGSIKNESWRLQCL